MKPFTISLVFLGLFFVAGFITSWIRHWPSNLTRGTQHILLVGLMLQSGFLGAAIVLLFKSCTPAVR